jgi:hypothetical protein
VKENPDAHFFLDEVLVSQVTSKVLAEISNTISKDNFFWVACQSDRLPSKFDPNLKGKTYNLHKKDQCSWF